MKFLCWLLGHRWGVRQPLPGLLFDQGGLRCVRCHKSLSIQSDEAALIITKEMTKSTAKEK
jgi:hypothetical protein